MDILTKRLTDDAMAQHMLALLEQGYTSPELTRDRLVYIKLNVLENKLKPKAPKECIDSTNEDRYLGCPNCEKPITNVWSSRVYRPHFCHFCGQPLDWERKEG